MKIDYQKISKYNKSKNEFAVLKYIAGVYGAGATISAAVFAEGLFGIISNDNLKTHIKKEIEDQLFDDIELAYGLDERIEVYEIYYEAEEA